MAKLPAKLLTLSLFAAALAGLTLTLDASAAPASLSPRPDPAASFSGNYLAARNAQRARDARAEALFLRESHKRAPGDSELLFGAFNASLVSGDMDESVTLANRILIVDPANPLARFVVGVRSMRAGRFDEARRDFSRAARGPLEIASMTLTAWSLLAEGAADQALELLDRLSDERAASFRDYHAGLIAESRGYTYEARKRLRAIYQADPKIMRTVDAWGRFLARTGQYDQARQVFTAFNTQFPGNPMIMAALRDLEAGRLLTAVAPDPLSGAAEALYGLGAAGTQQADPNNALIFMRLAVYLSPEHALAWTSLGDINSRIRQPERAIEAYSAIPAGTPLRSIADSQTALLLQSMEKPEEAIALITSAIATRPDDLRAAETLADLYRSQKNWSEAATAYGKGIEMIGEPKAGDWRWFYFRGIAFERSKRWPLAEADFKKALELNPDQPQVLNYLAYTWADQGVNLEEAREMLEKATKLASRDGHIIDSLGWVYYRLGRYEDAVRELERAIVMTPAEAVVNEHLGDVYWKLGRKREAVFKWGHALALNPEPEEIERINIKLKEASDLSATSGPL
ncbi:MAG: tetratricopeptide repeat protein [Beijerinckiaceae bacterium]|nr:tetratricopeptide repeat protein [Beijerinckiaceae bacterium]